MTAPPAGLLELGEQRIADPLEQVFKKGQGQTRTGGTVGGASERHAGQTRHRRAGGVAMENLQEKDVHRGYRIEHALAPGIVEVAADLGNGLSRQSLGNIGLELADDFGDIKGHPWPPVGVGG